MPRRLVHPKPTCPTIPRREPTEPRTPATLSESASSMLLQHIWAPVLHWETTVEGAPLTEVPGAAKATAAKAVKKRAILATILKEERVGKEWGLWGSERWFDSRNSRVLLKILVIYSGLLYTFCLRLTWLTFGHWLLLVETFDERWEEPSKVELNCKGDILRRSKGSTRRTCKVVSFM